jgi:poly(3-hydroxybutyrate) depolymerase
MNSLSTILLLFSLTLTSVQAATLTLVEEFGDNPADIKMYIYVPAHMPAQAPLVVSLHGCTQDAETYSHAGWIKLAEKWKFYLVFPEQTTANNIYRCWNWYEADNNHRGRGEAESIMEMIAKMKSDYSIDVRRIYVEGLSAGGWMASDLLASWPDVFAGGATIAGGPAFCAMTERYYWDYFGWWYNYFGVYNSQQCMAGTDKTPAEWGDLVREEGYKEFNGHWPVISIWQGSADDTVRKINQQELLDQWTNVQGIDEVPDKQEKLGPNTNVIHNEYQDHAGKALVETWLIPGMTHGTSIAVDAEHSCGEEGDYILNEGICAVRQIAHFWGLDKN